MNKRDSILSIKDLRTYFYRDTGIVRAVDGISLDVQKESILGIAGESGCGKTMTANSIMQLIPEPGKIVSGDINYDLDGKQINIVKIDPKSKKMRKLRGNEIAMIFQEPMSSLSPVHTIGDQIMEAILYHNKNMNKKQAKERTITLLKEVGIPDSEQRIESYTFELSGGLRQRAMIAMALSCYPNLLIADEPTTAIDVTIQAQILELINSLKEDFSMSIILITHDLGVIAEMAEEVAIMYLGKIVEKGNVVDIFHETLHPYTKALLKSIPKFEKVKGYLPAIEGSVPDPHFLPSGCEFAPRCDKASDICTKQKPALIKMSDDHYVKCFLYTDKKEAKIKVS